MVITAEWKIGFPLVKKKGKRDLEAFLHLTLSPSLRRSAKGKNHFGLGFDFHFSIQAGKLNFHVDNTSFVYF